MCPHVRKKRRAHPALALLLLFFLTAAMPAEAKAEYFTEDEIDLIRDAQEINQRVSLYFRLAEKRLIVLGLKEKDADELERERKEVEDWQKEKAKAEEAGRAIPKEPETEYTYLEEMTPAQLLRGYVQTLDEVMSNIDDAYSLRLEVRGPIEDLAEFARETLPLLEKFQPHSDGERIAMEEAVDKAMEALNGAGEALSIVPKTEEKTDR